MYYNTILPKRKDFSAFFVQYTLNIFYLLLFLVVSKIKFAPYILFLQKIALIQLYLNGRLNSADVKKNVENPKLFCYNKKSK